MGSHAHFTHFKHKHALLPAQEKLAWRRQVPRVHQRPSAARKLCNTSAPSSKKKHRIKDSCIPKNMAFRPCNGGKKLAQNRAKPSGLALLKDSGALGRAPLDDWASVHPQARSYTREGRSNYNLSEMMGPFRTSYFIEGD